MRRRPAKSTANTGGARKSNSRCENTANDYAAVTNTKSIELGHRSDPKKEEITERGQGSDAKEKGRRKPTFIGLECNQRKPKIISARCDVHESNVSQDMEVPRGWQQAKNTKAKKDMFAVAPMFQIKNIPLHSQECSVEMGSCKGSKGVARRKQLRSVQWTTKMLHPEDCVMVDGLHFESWKFLADRRNCDHHVPIDYLSGK